MTPRRPSRLSSRAEGVFDAMLHGRGHLVHPEDRAEAERFWQWLGTHERPAPATPVRPPLWRVAGLAAAMLALVVLGSPMPGDVPGGGTRAYAHVFESQRAERRTMRFVDGSVVTLAPLSRIEVRYDADRRYIRLVRGRGLFEVAGDAARPFVVQVAHGEVRALGTAFDVVVGTDESAVTVVEGTVRITLAAADGDADAVTKQARMGDMVRFGVDREGGEQIGFVAQSRGAEPDRTTAWTRGILIFRGEPLHQVIETVNLYSDQTVRLTDPRLTKTPIFGVLNQGDTSALRDLIAEPTVLTVSEERIGER